MPIETCPCGSRLEFQNCCEPLLLGKSQAATALSLMRSRYTAYVKGNIEYIEATHERHESDTVSLEETRKWSRNSTWLGLDILNTEKGGVNDEIGTVEFKAHYSSKGLKEVFYEKAEFIKKNGTWLYDKGKIIPTQTVRVAPKQGRNDPCACGSGKKYKFCHGSTN